MAYMITDQCLICRYPYACIYNCPVSAISNNGLHAEIDQSKCIQCGKCVSCCNLCAIVDTEKPAPAPIPHEKKAITCDILILGGGASGLIAALKASELTDKKILVLEKAKKPGGCGIYASALRMFNTKWELDAGIPDQMDDYIRSAYTTTRGLLDIQLIANAFHAIPTFFDWFCQWGEAEKGFYLNTENPLNGMRVQSILPDNGGNYILKKVIDQCGKRGIEILTECAATSFLQDKKGRIVGVTAQDSGGEITISSKAVLIATGNLGNCKELLEKCVPEYAQAYKRPSLHLLPTCTGDGVLMAEQAGIPINYDSIVPAYLGPMGTVATMQLMIQPGRSDALQINLEGKRWKNESFRAEACNWLLLQQPQAVSYTVMDQKILCSVPVTAPPVTYDHTFGRMISNGVPTENGMPQSDADVINLGPAGSPVPPSAFELDVQGEIDKALSMQGGFVFKGDTLQELAEKMGVDAEVFIETVERYNALCEKGHDDDFFKDPSLLLPIQEGPFYAFHTHMATDGVFGGLTVNPQMQVVGADGPVPGLYAAGDNTASRYVNHGGEKKQIINDFAWAVGSGYLAGIQMADYVNEGKEKSI